jgi:stage V sporulation protein B
MTKQSFIQGAMILLAAGIINRILGFVPRIMLPRFIGAEGVGLYQMGYPFLIVLITIITGGIPLAIAKLVAEAESENNEKRVRNILFVSLFFTVSLSVLFTLLCLWAAPWITTKLLTDARVYYTFMTMSPIIIFVSISAIFRGYFQGRHNMIPTAASQVFETLIRSVTMLLFAYILLPYGIQFAAAGAMAGVLFGELAGLLVLLYHYQRNRSKSIVYLQAEIGSKPPMVNAFSQFHRLLRISIPVTASKLVGSCSYFLESIMIVQSLAIAGIATHVATAQYGALTGMVIPVLLIPGALTYSLAVSLVPSLSQAAARNDMKTIHKRLHQSLKLALVTGAPFAIIMYVLAEPLCLVLFNDNSIGSMLKMMAPAALFIYFQGPLQATLQALDKPGTALLNTFVGAAIKLVLIYMLAANAKMGITGAVIAINVNIVLVTILHWQSVVRLLNFSIKRTDFLKVGLAMMIMGVSSYYIMSEVWSDSVFLRFTVSCLAGVLIYLILITWLKLVDKQDLIRIPWFGNKLAKWL